MEYGGVAVANSEDMIQYCEGWSSRALMAGDEVEISDGSPDTSPYGNNSECYWHFTAPEGQVVAVMFIAFDLEPVYDTVTVGGLVSNQW